MYQGRVGASVRAFLEVIDAFPTRRRRCRGDHRLRPGAPRSAATPRSRARPSSSTRPTGSTPRPGSSARSPRRTTRSRSSAPSSSSRRARSGRGPRRHRRARAGARAADPRARGFGAAARQRELEQRRGARLLRGGGDRLPRVPAAGRMARDGRARETRGVPRRDLLGPPDPRLRRSCCGAPADPGLAPAAHGANRTGRVFTATARATSVRGPAPHRLRQRADVRAPRDGLERRDCSSPPASAARPRRTCRGPRSACAARAGSSASST